MASLYSFSLFIELTVADYLYKGDFSQIKKKNFQLKFLKYYLADYQNSEKLNVALFNTFIKIYFILLACYGASLGFIISDFYQLNFKYRYQRIIMAFQLLVSVVNFVKILEANDEALKRNVQIQELDVKIKTLGVNMCSICLHEFQIGQNLKQLKCYGKHVYHQDCISAWLKTQKSCPYCRFQIK